MQNLEIIIYPKIIKELFLKFYPIELYLVGGYVRDYFLNKKDNFDLDFVTKEPLLKFLPIAKQIKNKAHVFKKYEAVSFSIKPYVITLTRLRRDIICDGRQAIVEFIDSIQEDAKRRDFTINAIYADQKGRIIDPLNGMHDLKKNKVVFIGNIEDRIKEDYLRIMRYFRFCSLFEDALDDKVLDIIKKHIKNLDMISHERIREEYQKIVKLPYGKKVLGIVNKKLNMHKYFL